MKRMLIAAAVILLGARLSLASTISIVGPGHTDIVLANETGLAHDTTFSLDMTQVGNNAAVQVIVGSGTYGTVTLTDGNQSTGTITVANNTTITTAAATGTITVLSTSNLTGAYVTVGSYKFTQGKEWNIKTTVALTAEDLKTAIADRWTQTTVTRNSGAILITAPYGKVWNTTPLTTSGASITVSGALMSGGRDAATLTINGVTLLPSQSAGSGKYVLGASAGATATNIAAGINATVALSAIMSASPSSSNVNLTSVLNGTAANYEWSTNSTGLTLTNSGLYGGTNPSVALNGGDFTATAHGLSLGMPVLYSANSAAFGGLTNQTTYFVIPGSNVNTIRLATTLARAVAGTYLTVTSTTSGTTAHAPTLAPLAQTGTVTYQIKGSNDNVNWQVLTSTGIVTYVSPYKANAVDLGAFNYRYLGIPVVGPTAGGVAFKAMVHAVNTAR